MSKYKYSDKKIVWFPEKLQSFVSGKITAPIYVRIKPLNACNHKCYWCVYHESDLSDMHKDMKNKDMISEDKMLEIIDDLSSIGVEAVTYSGGGEPLMHPSIEKILQKTLHKNIALSVITNGQFLKNDIASILTKSSWIRVSVDYCDEDSFVFSRRINKVFFKEIFNNIYEFSKIKENSCDFGVNFIFTKDNFHNLNYVTNLLKDCGIDNIRFSPMWITNFQEYHKPIKNEIFKKIDELRILENDKFKIYSSYNPSVIENMVTTRPYKKCYVMQYNPVIGADLNVYACHNQAYSHDSIITSLKDKTFTEAWFSKEAIEFHNNFECQKICTSQCASDRKNLFIHDLLLAQGDSFI